MNKYPDQFDTIKAFYPEREHWQQVQKYLSLTDKIQPHIKTVFFGDSLTGS